jgi:hypothetical protein
MQGGLPASIAALAGRASLRVGTLGLLLSGSGGGEELPILEAALSHVAADAALRGGRLSGSLAARAAANAYSVQQAGWEPFIEPWRFSVEGQTALPGCVLFS